jgi:hypothetical protein
VEVVKINEKDTWELNIGGSRKLQRTLVISGFDEQMTMFKPSLCALRTW